MQDLLFENSREGVETNDNVEMITLAVLNKTD